MVIVPVVVVMVLLILRRVVVAEGRRRGTDGFRSSSGQHLFLLWLLITLLTVVVAGFIVMPIAILITRRVKEVGFDVFGLLMKFPFLDQALFVLQRQCLQTQSSKNRFVNLLPVMPFGSRRRGRRRQ